MENPLFRLQEQNVAELPDPFSSAPAREMKSETPKRTEKKTNRDLDIQKPHVQFY